jgi:hypothetical protein
LTADHVTPLAAGGQIIAITELELALTGLITAGVVGVVGRG